MTSRHIGFLFNHEAVHQIAHSAPTAFELSRIYPDVKIDLLSSSVAQTEELKRISLYYPGANCELIEIDCALIHKVLDVLFGKLAPVRKVAVLRNNLKLFSKYDALVTPEKTSAMIKHRFGLKDLNMIYARHGAGDRALSFNEDNAKFDYLLLPGPKFRDRLREEGHLEGREYKIIGYPKFDVTIGRQEGKELRRQYFKNDNPIVLYNPHFDPRLSSWYKLGDKVLDYFRKSQDYNLIFAPHIMLFERLLHISLEERHFMFRKKIARKYRDSPNIWIDTGSTASTDMTYTMLADIYLGDVSSQIYEFLYHSRPVVFLNAHDANWRDDANYNHWRLGAVISSVDKLDGALREAKSRHRAEFIDRQKEAFAYTFDIEETPSAKRAAEAIAEYLGFAP